MENRITTADIRVPDKQNYTLSLLDISVRSGLISAKQSELILRQFNEIFLETAQQYTKRESSTIPKTAAQKIYLTLFFQSDIYLKSLDSDTAAVSALQAKSVQMLTELGKKRILRMLEQTKLIYGAAVNKRVNVRIEEYNYAVDKAFDEFCGSYSARFDALNICCDINYPLLNIHPLDMPERGVEFMLTYYSSLLRENRFCGYFSPAEIERVLTLYGKTYGVRYNHLLFNIASVLLGNLLVGALLDKPLFNLSLSLSDKTALESYCSVVSADCLRDETEQAFERYKKIFGNNLHAYLSGYIPIFCEELYARARNGVSENYIVYDM